MIITTPTCFGGKLHHLLSEINLFTKEFSEEHKTFFTKKELFKLAKQSGFKIRRYERFEFGLNHLLVLDR